VRTITHKFVEGHAAKCALVDKAQFTASISESDSDPQVLFIRSIGWLNKQLPTHSEVAHDREITPIKYKPEVLTPTTH
jgi:hypothetical protein